MGGRFKLRISRMLCASFGSCRPRNTANLIEKPVLLVTKELPQRKKISERSQCFVLDDTEGRTCPPASPISSLNSYYKFQEFEGKERKKKSRKTKNNKKRDSYHFSSEEETETFFSSKSFSSEYHCRKKNDFSPENSRSSTEKISEHEF